MSPPRLTLYGRDGCSLCVEARGQLRQLDDGGCSFVLREVDVDTDEQAARRYLERIPVLELEGEIVYELVPDADAVRERLGKLRG
ncbi:MAG: glutaredoxin family protein [Solirubrobacterales bacterium]